MADEILLSQINPFVRFAAETVLAAANVGHKVCPADCRLFFLIEGECRLLVDGYGEFRLKQHSAMLLPCGFSYAIIPYSPVLPRLISINFDYTQARSHMDQPFPLLPGDHVLADSEREFHISDCEALNRPLCIPEADALEPILAEMQQEAVERRRFFERQLSACLTRAITLLLRQALWEDKRQPQAVEQMIGFIQAHYASPLTNEQIAGFVNYHPVHANRLMHIHTGKTLHQYLLSCRLQRALELLLNSPLSVTEIALKTGFSSSSRFSKDFKAATGHTPSDFRRTRPEHSEN